MRKYVQLFCTDIQLFGYNCAIYSLLFSTLIYPKNLGREQMPVSPSPSPSPSSALGIPGTEQVLVNVMFIYFKRRVNRL
jgi:hypothetical protein